MNEQLKLFKTLLKTDLSFFTQKVFTTVDPGVDYLHNWHIDLIAEYLLACKRGEIKRLIINIPPRHLKSISVAVAFPAWLLGINPSEQIMCASYSEELSYQHSMNCRLLLDSPWYKQVFPETKLAHDQNTKRKFITTQRGHRIAASVGGTATGEGGNFLIVDDPISAEQALSEIYRERAKRWFFQTFSTRLNDKKNGVMIVIMQRLHEDDLTGHLLRSGGWEHLCLPLIAEQDETLEKGKIKVHRKEGDLLHPDRIGPQEVEQIKSDLKHNFIGQYQQRPSPEGGGEFLKEWLMYYDKIDHTNFNNYILVDPANTKKPNSDYTAAVVFGAGEDRNLYLIDAVRDKLNPREREDLMFDWHRKYQPKLVVYEKYGMQVDIDWIRKAMEDRNYRFRAIEVGGRLIKGDRIRRLKHLLSDRKIYFPKVLYKTNYEGKVVDVIEEFIQQEYAAYPVGLHDDMLDAMSRIVDISDQIIYPGKGNIDYYKIYNHNY